MENKYNKQFIDSTLLSMDNAPDEIKTSANYDATNTKKPYGYFLTDRKNSSFNSWFSDLNTIYAIIKNCQELDGFSTMTTIIYYDKDGNEDGVNHTSFDGRVDSLKKDIDTGNLAKTDLVLTVFKNPEESLVESFLKNL